MTSIDEQTMFLQQQISSLFEKHVPLKTIKKHPSSPKWLTTDIQFLMQKRDVAYKNWKKYRLHEFLNRYRYLRNKVITKIRSAKFNYFSAKLGSFTSGEKLWKQLRQLGYGKQKLEIPTDIDCDKLNSEFITVPALPSSSRFTPDIGPEGENENLFNFKRIREEDIVQAILAIKSNAVGLDGLSPKFIKLLLPFILPYITYIFNNVITMSVFPTEWKKAKIVPIPKKPSGNVKEYRPIAILPFLSKVFEKVVLSQICEHLTTKHLLCSNQSGFRPKRSCKTALIHVVEEIRRALDKNHPTFLTLLDFSKAFDTVDHSILCRKLSKEFKFSTFSTKLIFSYLDGRKQCVTSGERSSGFLNVQCGVPQGSILGPLLFSLYVNELPGVVKHSSVHMFADDVQLLLSCPLNAIDTTISLLNEDLSGIYKWSLKHNLRLNPKKSKVLPIYKKPIDVTVVSKAQLAQCPIEWVVSARNLGIVFNRTLSWDTHINTTIGKVYGGLRTLWATQRFLPITTKLMLAKTLLLPVLLYGCEIFFTTDYNSRRKLNVIYNNIARYIFNLKRRDHVSRFSKQISGCTFDNLLKYRSLCLLNGIIHTRQPDYLYDKLEFFQSRRSLMLIQPKYSCVPSERQFFVQVIRLWNSLPPSLRRIGNMNNFKPSLLMHLAL